MTILEQILAGLQQRFTGVDAAILTRFATKKAEGVTDASQVPTILEGVGFSDVLTSYGDFRAGDASTSAVANYEKKHNLKGGKPIENPNPNPQPAPQPSPQGDMATIIANAVSAAMKPLSDKLTQIEAEKSQATRQEQIQAKAKEYGIPETLVPMLKIADDADLDVFMKDAKQTFTNNGLQVVTPPETAHQKLENNSQELAGLIDKGTEELNKK